MTEQAISINRPNGIALFQLLSLKGAMRLEGMGLKHSLSPLRPKWAAKLGLKPRAKHEVYIAEIERLIKEIEAKGDLGITRS